MDSTGPKPTAAAIEADDIVIPVSLNLRSLGF